LSIARHKLFVAHEIPIRELPFGSMVWIFQARALPVGSVDVSVSPPSTATHSRVVGHETASMLDVAR